MKALGLNESVGGINELRRKSYYSVGEFSEAAHRVTGRTLQPGTYMYGGGKGLKVPFCALSA